MNKSKYSTFFSFIDILFITLFCVIFVSFFLMIIAKPDEGAKSEAPKAEFMITSEWSETVDCDVDFWVLTPANNKVYFRAKESDFINLERDDRGFIGDVYTDPTNGVKLYGTNNETLMIRNGLPGTYFISLHLYTCRDENGYNKKEHTPIDPLSVKVRFIQLNPEYKEKYTTTIIFHKIWEEQPIAAFSFKDHVFTRLSETVPPLVDIEGYNSR